MTLETEAIINQFLGELAIFLWLLGFIKFLNYRSARRRVVHLVILRHGILPISNFQWSVTIIKLRNVDLINLGAGILLPMWNWSFLIIWYFGSPRFRAHLAPKHVLRPVNRLVLSIWLVYRFVQWIALIACHVALPSIHWAIDCYVLMFECTLWILFLDVFTHV